jgi:hypothetical protein
LYTKLSLKRRSEKMIGLKKPDFACLADWMEDRLTEEAAVVVENQVAAGDIATLADVAWLRRFMDASEKIILPSAPAGAHENLIDHFEAYARDKQQPGLRKRIVAKQTFDSGLRPAVAEVREADTAELGRQLVYAADALDVALDILPRDHEERSLDLEGQLFNDEETDLGIFGVQLLQEGTEVGTTVSDDLGEFAFESVPPGVYEMLLSTDQYEIMLPPVELVA